jgi:hypothetical protein
VAKSQVVTCSERRCSLVTRKSGGRACLSVREGSRSRVAELIRRLPPSGAHDALLSGVSATTWDEGSKWKLEKSVGTWRRNPAKEALAITVSGKCERRSHDGGTGCSTVDSRAAKRGGREGPEPLNNLK